MTRVEIADRICARLAQEKAALTTQFRAPGRVPAFVLDDLLPDEMARAVFQAYPPPSQMLRRHSLRESKYVAVQLDRYAPLLEEVVYAFQDPRVMALFTDITGIDELLPDPRLYAGGCSAMVRDSFLNPHLDNSHDGKQEHYRVLNSLYYVTPDWREEYGGNLELWDQGPKGPPRPILSKFNRLVLMATNRSSWHSVTRVRHQGSRCCVSNYFFRTRSLEGRDYFHATSFRGRPEQPARDLLLRADNFLRTTILSVVKVPTRHIYKK